MFNVAALRLARLRGLTQGQLVKRELIIGSALFNPLLSYCSDRSSPSHGLTTPVDEFRDPAR